jgi:ubiquinone/menaquinone biosynthesis C-methylase UbiE
VPYAAVTMASEIEREAQRVREAYLRRAERGLDRRYEYWKPANLYIYQSRERALLSILREAGLLPLAGRQVLDAGCGDGGVLFDLLRFGVRPESLYGIDLLPDRVERARERLPGATIATGDAQAMSFPSQSFDLTLGFTLLSSVTDPQARQRVAREMRRATKPGGLIVLYDFWTNPFNRDVRPLSHAVVRRLFRGCEVEFRSVTLAPPIVRALVGLPGGWLACSVLEVIPFLRTHYLAAVHV